MSKLIQLKFGFSIFNQLLKSLLSWASTMGFHATGINITVQFSPLLHPHLPHHTSIVIAALGISSVSKLALFLWLSGVPAATGHQ